MATYNVIKEGKASTGERKILLGGLDPNIDMRLSILEKKMDKLIETLAKKDD